MKGINNLILLIILGSCNFQEKDPEKSNAKEPGTTAGPQTNCYRYVGNFDTIFLKVIQTGKTISGTLIYNLKEKDKNTGTILGSMGDNVLLADYTFISEGIQSTRQVAFKLEGNTFIEGYGEIVNQKNRVYFKAPDSLDFNTSMKLMEIDCQ